MRNIQERWKAAQEQEQKQNEPESWEAGYDHFKKVAGHYFELLQMNPKEQTEKSIIEVGPANFPISMYFNGASNVTLYEPIGTSHFERSFSEGYNSSVIASHWQFAIEQADMKGLLYSEAWLFNVLQHVQDPVKVINKCKKHAKVIRFFEPINAGTDVCHLHEFDIEFFRKHFGDCVKLYKFSENEHRNEFHRADCAYGTYIVK